MKIPEAPEINNSNFPHLPRKQHHRTSINTNLQQTNPTTTTTLENNNVSYSNSLKYENVKENLNDFNDLITELRNFDEKYNIKLLLKTIRELDNRLGDKTSNLECCLTLFEFIDNGKK